MAQNRPYASLSVEGAPDSEGQRCGLALDIPELFERRASPHFYALVAAHLLFWAGIVFLIGADVEDEVEGSTWGASTVEVDCELGLPRPLKSGALAFILVFMLLELWVAWQTKIGRHLLRDRKRIVVIACALGCLARYDVFSDVWFTMLADACGSPMGSWSRYAFICGVLLAQAIPGLWYLLRERSTHMSLKLNDFLLLLEVIDPSRCGLKLPEKVRNIALGESLRTVDQAQGGSADAGDQPLRNPVAEKVEWAKFASPQSPEAAQRLKAEVEAQVELDEAKEKDDPDVLKNLALIAHAKWLGGLLRFFAEDLVQGILQMLYLWENWGETVLRTKLMIISSTLAGVLVSLGSPVAARIQEGKNRESYNKLPKMYTGESWQGIDNESGTDGGGNAWSSWAAKTFVAEEVTKQPGDSLLSVRFKVLNQVLLREVNGAAEWQEGLHSSMHGPYLNPMNYALYETDLAGTYDVNTATLDLKHVKHHILSSTGATQLEWNYTLRVLPDRLVGSGALSADPDKKSKLVLKFLH